MAKSGEHEVVGQRTEVKVRAGDLSFSIFFNEDKVTSIGPVSFDGVQAGGVVLPAVDAAVLLRVAEIVETERAGKFDRRGVCVLHGFTEDKYHDCPRCTAEAQPPPLSDIAQAVVDICRPTVEPL